MYLTVIEQQKLCSRAISVNCSVISSLRDLGESPLFLRNIGAPCHGFTAEPARGYTWRVGFLAKRFTESGTRTADLVPDLEPRWGHGRVDELAGNRAPLGQGTWF